MRLPWMKFYPGDWLRDTRALSVQARGAWIDLIAYMSESPRPGALLRPNGTPWTSDQVARSLSISVDEWLAIRRELVDSGTCSVEPFRARGHSRDIGVTSAGHSRDIGVTECEILTSRRMIRDAEERSKWRLRSAKRRKSLSDQQNCHADVSPDVTRMSPVEVRSQKSEENSARDTRARDRAAPPNGAPEDPIDDAQWEEYIGVFVAAGKPLNEADIGSALRQWLSIDAATRATALADIQLRARASDAQFVPAPVNHLTQRPWTRKSATRTLPAPTPHRREGLAERTLRRFAEAEAAAKGSSNGQ